MYTTYQFDMFIDYCCCCWALSCVWLFCNPMDYSPPGSSVHGIFQARVPKWVAISFSRGSSWPRDWTRVSCIGRRILYHWATREALLYLKLLQNNGYREIKVCCLSHPVCSILLQQLSKDTHVLLSWALSGDSLHIFWALPIWLFAL